MIKFSRKTEYALIAIQYIANKGITEFSTAKEISDNYNISYELLAKILQRLAKNNIITSTKGVNGGYKFIKSPDDVTLSEIIESLNESYALTRCLKKNRPNKTDCQIADCCTLKNPVAIIQNRLNIFFDDITIRHLM